MKIIKKIITTVFTICISVAMTMPVFASVNLKDSTLTPDIIKNNQNTLGYLISNERSETLFQKVATSTNIGSINIFGNDNGTWYETSKLAGSTPYRLTGLFPVLAVGDETNISNHANLDNDNGILNGYLGGTTESDSVVMAVTPEFVLEQQYIKITFKLENKTGTSKTVSFGAYSDIQVNGKDIDEAITSSLGGNGLRLLKQGSNAINYILKVPTGDTLIKDYVTDVNSIWFGNRGTASGNSEYEKLFANTLTTTYDTTIDNNDSAMTFAWVDEEMEAGATLTKSILIGVGPVVTVTGQETYNLDESKDVIVNGKLSDPSLQTGESNQLYYSVNGGTSKKLGDPKTDKYTDYEINLKDETELKPCSDNNVKVWVADKDDANKIISNVAEHNFKLTSKECVGVQKQTGINLSYVIITTILCGGIIAFVYSKKHTKFPQV